MHTLMTVNPDYIAPEIAFPLAAILTAGYFLLRRHQNKKASK